MKEIIVTTVEKLDPETRKPIEITRTTVEKETRHENKLGHPWLNPYPHQTYKTNGVEFPTQAMLKWASDPD